jgi:hypothetical protein
VIVSFLTALVVRPKPPISDGGPLGGAGAVAEHMEATGGEADAADAAVAGNASGDGNGDGGSGDGADDDEELRRRTDERLSKRHLHLDPGGYFLVRVNRATAMLEATHHPCTVDDTTGLVVDATGKPVAAKGRLEVDQVRAVHALTHTAGLDRGVSAGGEGNDSAGGQALALNPPRHTRSLSHQAVRGSESRQRLGGWALRCRWVEREREA